MSHFKKPYDRDSKRAQKRIQGEDVYGNKIQVVTSATTTYGGRRMKTPDSVSSGFRTVTPPPGFTVQNNSRYSAKLTQDHESSTFLAKGQYGSNLSLDYDLSGWNSSRNTQETACSLPNVSKRVHKISGSSDFSDEGIASYISNETIPKTQPSDRPIDLFISNLDSTMDKRDLRRQLTSLFGEFVLVISLNIFANSDGSPIANIKVNNHQAAQFAISQLHKRKLGNKRIEISYAQENSPELGQLKAMIIALLQEVPDKSMPLFNFVDLFESRYNYFVPVSELKKFKDVCHITDDSIPRMITLRQEVKSLPTPNLSQTMVPYCPTHCMNYPYRGWLETNCVQLPNVMMPLKLFATKVNGLLYSHLGSVHLLSFQMCYEQEYKEPLPVNDAGVPLEHLITCVPNIEITCVGPSKSIKVITYNFKANECTEESVLKNVPASLAPNISLLCRQVVDLLKTSEKCQILLSKFIPAYHHHFGMQCRVADYGYTKLSDLFESLPHVVQIIGDGFRKMITLTHSAQMRRFTSDLMRVLRAQPLKKVPLDEFPSAYEKVLCRPFNAVDYGLCTFEDLLDDVPEHTVARENDDIVISIPKREQTDEEIVRMKQFITEVIDLLKCTPYCTILFDRFIPSYHHYFGYQCKVSSYGFTKLIDLFKAIPEIVEVREVDGMRVVSLTLDISLKFLGRQIHQAIRNTNMSSVALEDLQATYMQEFGCALDPYKYECQSVDELVEKLSDNVEVIHSNAGTLLMAYELDTISTLCIRGWALFLNGPYIKESSMFKYEYHFKYNTSYSKNDLMQLTNVFVVSKTSVSLTNQFILAAELYHILIKHSYGVHFDNLEKIYATFYGKSLKLNDYGIGTVEEFAKMYNMIFFVHQKKKVVVLHKNLREHFVVTAREMNHMEKINDIISKRPMNGSKMGAGLKIKALKPDTPPTPNTLPWSPPQNDLPFSINLPIVQNPVLIGDPASLISPCRLLFPSGFFGDLVSAPEPNELPMPDQLMMCKGTISDDSTDSGVNTKLDNSPSNSYLFEQGSGK